jgi:tRNA (Thr-GGU) A37 N-methylase
VRGAGMETVTYTPIGVMRTPYGTIAGMPVQAVGAADVPGTIELDPAYGAGLRDVEGFSHLILRYQLHLIRSQALEVRPLSWLIIRPRRSTDGPRRCGVATTRHEQAPEPARPTTRPEQRCGAIPEIQGRALYGGPGTRPPCAGGHLLLC